MNAVADDRGLVLCEFSDRPMLPLQLRRAQAICGATPEDGDHPVLAQTQTELDEYFLGKRDAFTIPLVLEAPGGDLPPRRASDAPLRVNVLRDEYWELYDVLR